MWKVWRGEETAGMRGRRGMCGRLCDAAEGAQEVGALDGGGAASSLAPCSEVNAAWRLSAALVWADAGYEEYGRSVTAGIGEYGRSVTAGIGEYGRGCG